MVKAPLKQTYRARADGWIAGQRVEKDALLELTPDQAKYEPVDLEPTPAEKTATKRRAEAEPS
ncbi:hypothetical protein [Paracoccus aminovorans]|uniref:hypothetical protein n=1 Tax=Paracoccus aminovorans TaxID=34004 RepID=UPI000785FFFE|nr:hypothetical protein [Paracoccus aminovorans]